MNILKCSAGSDGTAVNRHPTGCIIILICSAGGVGTQLAAQSFQPVSAGGAGGDGNRHVHPGAEGEDGA